MMGVATASASARWWRGTATAAPVSVRAPAETAPKGRVAFRALMVLTLIIVLAPQHYVTALQPLRIAFVAAAITGLAYLMQRLAHRAPLLEFNREIKITGLLLAWAVVTIPFSYWPGGSVQFLVGMFLKTLVFFVLLANVVDTRRRFVAVTWALVLMAVPLALSGVRNYLTGSFVSNRIVGHEGGLTANPNDLALMLNLILPLALGLFVSSTRWLHKAVLAGICALIVAGIVVTFSRSGFLTLALIGAFYVGIFFRRGHGGLAVAAIVLALAAVPFLPASYLDRLTTIASIESDETGSSQARWNDTVAAVKYVAGNPLVGAGVGQNALAMNQMRGDHWLRVHNVYLEYAVELGLPGALLYVLLVSGCIGAARTAKRRALAVPDADARFGAAVQGVWVALIAFAFAALFYPAGYQFYFFLFAGLALAARSIGVPEAER